MSKTKSIWGEPFLWGAATSSHQVEGHNKHNDWWAWETKGKVDGGVKSGPAADHRTHFRTDLALAKSLGLNSYRFSFEWSRFEPEEGKWDQAAVDWYLELIAECERLDLVPMATLHHFTLPHWLAEQGGFSGEAAPKKFASYVERIAKIFGSRIPLWCTVNEPMVLVAGSYLGGFMPPGEYQPRSASRASYNLLRAHVLAYDILRARGSKREGPFKDRPLEVGFAHNMLHFQPERKWHPVEHGIAKALSFVYNESWLKAVNGERQAFGLPGVFPFAPQLASARGRRTFDFIGLNYYTKAYVQWRPRTQAKESVPELPVGISFARRKETASDLGWAVHPWGLRVVLEKLRRFRSPIYITENGIADADDDLRSEYIHGHLSELATAKKSGLDIRGYYHWSLIDNFEWIKGFWPRFGLCEVDYETFARVPRPSANFLKSIIEAHPGGRAPDAAILGKFADF